MPNAMKPAKLAIKDGLYVCPVCKSKTNQAADASTNAEHLLLWCRRCKAVHIVNIEFGQCYVVSRYR